MNTRDSVSSLSSRLKWLHNGVVDLHHILAVATHLPAASLTCTRSIQVHVRSSCTCLRGPLFIKPYTGICIRNYRNSNMSSTTVQGGNGLCDYCHQKPKHGNYDFCGKTCSLQASATPSLCKQCQQKPPFQNFDFCGKHCASLWQANHPGLGNGFPSTAQTSGSGLLKLKMPNINMPSLQNIKAQPLQPHPQNQLLPAPQMPPVVKGGHGVKSNRSPPSNVNKAIAPPVMPPPPPQQQSTSSRKGGSGNNVLTPAPPGICRIQGCGKPVHAAGTRNPSEYCSLRHREEAVELGADPCIMCRKLPRGVTDHFCSTTCRNAALRP